jgi:hypothetical protein
MKIDPDLMALLKATKKVSVPVSESIERRVLKLHQLVADRDNQHNGSSDKAA